MGFIDYTKNIIFNILHKKTTTADGALGQFSTRIWGLFKVIKFPDGEGFNVGSQVPFYCGFTLLRKITFSCTAYSVTKQCGSTIESADEILSGGGHSVEQQ